MNIIQTKFPYPTNRVWLRHLTLLCLKISFVIPFLIAPALNGNLAAQSVTTDLTSASPVFKTMDNLEWNLLDPSNPDGPQIAVLWGDVENGPYGALLRFQPGFASPMHSHLADEFTVTIRGVTLHWFEGESSKDAIRLTPGSYTMIPGNLNHVSACAEDSPEECVAFLTQSTGFDFTLAGIEEEQ
jgi:quercetin dioxygenase-like cupin family protein